MNDCVMERSNAVRTRDGGARKPSHRGARQRRQRKKSPQPSVNKPQTVAELKLTPHMRLALDFINDGEESIELLGDVIEMYNINDFQSIGVSFPPLENDSSLSHDEVGNILVSAARQGCVSVISMLLDAGFSIDATGSLGVNALTMASLHNHCDVMTLLLERGAQVNLKQPNGQTALHFASKLYRIPALGILLAAPDIDINTCDNDQRTALHLSAMMGGLEVTQLLTKHGAKVMCDAYGLHQLSYAYDWYTDMKDAITARVGKKTKNPKAFVLAEVAMLSVTAIANICGSFFSVFDTVKQSDARDLLVSQMGVTKVFRHLALHDFAIDDNHSYNQIIIVLCRVLKTSKESLNATSEEITKFLSILVTENNTSSLESLAAFISHSQQWLTIDVMSALSNALRRSARICIFGQQPHQGFALEFLFIMMPIYLRIVLAIAHKLDETMKANLASEFNDIWKLLDCCLSDIDAHIQESDRFAIIINCFYEFEQVFPLDSIALNAIDKALYLMNKNKKDPKKRSIKRLSSLPSLDFFLYKREVSSRFIEFTKKHSFALHFIALELESYGFKLFDFMFRVGGLSGKAFYLRNVAEKDSREASISLNRFHSKSSTAFNSNNFDFFVQQILALPSKAFHRELHVNFHCEPAVGEGPIREMMEIFRAYVFSSNSKYFAPAPSGVAFHVRNDSPSDTAALQIFEAVGRIVGLSVNTTFPFGVCFTHALLSKFLGLTLKLSSPDAISTYDDELVVSMRKLMMCDMNDMNAELFFVCAECQSDGTYVDTELVKGGNEMRVTNKNKKHYMSALFSARLWRGIETQVTAMCKGFSAVVPRNISMIINTQDLNQLVQGPAQLDVEWMQNSLVKYGCGYSIDDVVVQWFWQYLRELTPIKQARLLQFWTGSSTPPLDTSFAPDTSWFILPYLASSTKLPVASTCTFTLQIPPYTSLQQLSERFDLVLDMGFIGFDVD